MAEEEAPENSSAKPRRIRKVETVREKAESAAAAGGKVSRKRKVARAVGKPFRPVGRGAQRVERFKPVHILGLVIFPRYFRNSFRELRQVTWPDFKTSWRLTFAVLMFATVFGLVIALVDFGLDKLFKQVLLK